jgi:hypothetical protein
LEPEPMEAVEAASSSEVSDSIISRTVAWCRCDHYFLASKFGNGHASQ